jgi:uncharacterized membrane protein
VNWDDKLIVVVKWLLATLQLGAAVFILSALLHVLRQFFSSSQGHPDDLSRPFSLQRIGSPEGGSKSQFPRRNFWIAIAFFSLCALVWLVVFHYAGLLILHWSEIPR